MDRAMDTRRQARLRQQQAQQHQDQPQQRPAVAARRTGGWWVEDGGSLEPRDGRVSSKNETAPVCILFHTRSSRTNQVTAPRVPGVLLYVLLHCCTAVCSKGLVGGWVEGTLRRPRWVGGPFRTWKSFFVLWEMNLLVLFLEYRPPTGAWEYHRRPHCCTPLSFATVRTAALPCCCPVIIWFCGTCIQRMIHFLPYVQLHCRAAL